MNTTFKSIAFILLLVWTSASIAQQGSYTWKEGKDGAYSYMYVPGDPTAARFYKLNNGLTVILSPTKKEPRIQTYIATKAGGKTDPKDHTGLAHYLEHMLFKGTARFGSLDWEKEKPLLDEIEALYERYNKAEDPQTRQAIYREIDSVSGLAAKFAIPNEYDKLMSNMGAEGTNAFTSYEQTVYIEDIPNTVIDKYLTVQAERFRAPVLRLFHTELETVYEEKNMSLDNDNRKAIEAIFSSLFPNNNYGKQTILGSVEHLRNPSLKAINEYYNTYYVPNNMGIIMSGDFEPAEMIRKIDQAFAYMQPKTIPAYQFDAEEPITKPIVREVKGPNPELLLMGFRFPGAATEEAQMLNLMASILTNGSAGLIDLDLVKSQKLLGAGAFPYILKDYSMLILQGNPSQGQSLDQVRELLLTTLAKLRDGDFSDDLITSIINNERKSQIMRTASYKSRAEDLMNAFTSEVNWVDELAYMERLAKITKKDVVAFANKFLNEQNYVAVYKRQGTDATVDKVAKPAITPITINRDAQSAFQGKINEIPEAPITPQWINYEKDLSKGVLDGQEILTVQNQENELFNLSYQFNVGGWDNKLLPLALGYFQFLGTANHSSEYFSTEFYKLASSFRVSAGDEETTISVSGLNENFVQTVRLIQQLLRECVADQVAFEAFKGRLKRSRLNAKNDKKNILAGLQAYAKYGAKNPFNYTLTDVELDQLRAEDLVSLLHDLAETEHTILYYGPWQIQQLTAALPPLKNNDRAYRTVKRGERFIEKPTTANQVLLAHYDMKQVEIFWLRNTERYDVEKAPIISLFNSYFGGGMGSIVFQTLREARALAYTTYAYYGQPRKKENHGMVGAYIATQSDKLTEALEGMNDLLNTLPESPMALETARVSLQKSIASDRIGNENKLNNYLMAKRLGNTTDIRKNIYERLPSLQYADLKAFHAEQLANKPYNYCVIGDEESLNMEELQKTGEVKKVSLEEIFGY